MCSDPISVFCIGVMGAGLGFFLAFFLYGWFEERSDRYDRIVWHKQLGRCTAEDQPYTAQERMPWP